MKPVSFEYRRPGSVPEARAALASDRHIQIVSPVTPSPRTVSGQKGSGESGYAGSPAGIAPAINDALRPAGVRIDKLPMIPSIISDLIAAGPRQEIP